MKSDELSRAIGKWHSEWAAKWADTIEPDPEYADNNPSQYPEGAVHMSASVEAQDEYWAGVQRILADMRKHGDHDQSTHGHRGGAAEKGSVPDAPPGQPPFPDEFAGYRVVSSSDVDEWAIDGFAAWSETVTGDEGRAIARYTEDGYRDINGILREGLENRDLKSETYRHDQNSDWVARDTLRLISAVDRGRMPEDTVVYRGTTSTLVPDDIKPGDVLTDAGFLSTSVGQRPGLGGPTVLRIAVPKDSAAAYPDVTNFSSNEGEKEVILQAGARMTVAAVHESVPNQYYGSRRYVDVVLSNGRGSKKSVTKGGMMNTSEWLSLPEKTTFNEDGTVNQLSRKFVADVGEMVLIRAEDVDK